MYQTRAQRTEDDHHVLLVLAFITACLFLGTLFITVLALVS